MKRVIAIAAAAVLLTWVVLIVRSPPSQSSSAKANLQSALTNPVEFAKERVTGGIGVAIGPDPATGLPRIVLVSGGSPADKAGLRARDVILKVDGVGTTNTPVLKVGEKIKGMTGGSVVLTIQRDGGTFDCTIRRESWRTLRTLSYTAPPHDTVWRK